ncbi:MAG: succinylglutamate desuccinylase/aspartoacylase family protein [Acidobacteria bacterium]|nr:succinylglutamate desuccinylase/aspartoacylase family protein [Acidobacteriota bacterium]
MSSQVQRVPKKNELFNVGEVAASPGEKKKGFAVVAQTSLGSLIRVPVIVSNGLYEGPTLLVDSGIHGDDLTSIPVVWKVAEEIDPRNLRGQVICLPFANPMAIEGKSHLTPEDGKSPIFPGRPDGTISERLGYGLYNEIVLKSNYIIDLHGGSMEASLAILVVVDPVGGETEKTITEMARAFNPNLIFVSAGKGEGPPNTMHGVANRKGIPSLNIGMGKIGFYEESTRRGADSVFNVMRYLKMLDGSPQVKTDPLFATKEVFKFSSHNGAFFPTTKEDEMVTEGQTVGRIVDVFGDMITEVKAPATGMVLAICFYPIVKAGDFLISVATPKKE